MKHTPIAFGTWLELYVQAHYFRPDGVDRHYPDYQMDYAEIITLAYAQPYEVQSFSFTYFRGLSTDQLDLKSTLTMNIDTDSMTQITEIIQECNADCPPLIQVIPSRDPQNPYSVSYIITEQY
jgi:hypothetical protein